MPSHTGTLYHSTPSYYVVDPCDRRSPVTGVCLGHRSNADVLVDGRWRPLSLDDPRESESGCVVDRGREV